MKHPSNRDLFQYWNEQRGVRPAPERADIEPGAIRHVLGDIFMIETDRAGKLPFRIAGTRLCALFGRELKGEGFATLWQRADQAALRELIAVVTEEKVGVIASVNGATADDTLLPVQLEMLMLPLGYHARRDTRLLGGLAPMATPYWLGARAIGPLALGMFRHVGAAVEANEAPRLQAAPGRIRHGLTVYNGGRAE